MKSPEGQRGYWRKVKRRRRDRHVHASSLAHGHCTRRRQGGGGPCRTPLEVRVTRDGAGRQTREIHCPSCSRRRAGICQHCERPVAGRVGFASYCDGAECRRLARKRWRLTQAASGR